MPTDPRIDAYIEKSAPFARPILTHLRAVVHQACPEVEETMKWSFPHFDHHGMMCYMASFKEHCAFGFWKGSLILGEGVGRGEAMGQFGRITSLRDLPAKRILIGYVKEAKRLNEAGIAAPHVAQRRDKANSPPSVEVPPALEAALRKNAKAKATFERFSPSHRREYTEWIADAKREETRARRVAQAVEMLAEGKSRNWKYEKRG